MFQPRYTMNGYELKEEPSANSSGHSRVLRTLLTSKLPLLQPNMQQTISEALTQEFEAREDQNGTVVCGSEIAQSAYVLYSSHRAVVHTNILDGQEGHH